MSQNAIKMRLEDLEIKLHWIAAFDDFNERRNTLKMTTGYAELDSLIDSIQQGQFYLFYGQTRMIQKQTTRDCYKSKHCLLVSPL